MKMKISVAKEIRTSQFSLACVRDSENRKEIPHTLLELLSAIPRKAALISSVKLTFLFVKPI